MSKFDRTVISRATGPIKTIGTATTFEGGAGFARDAKSELFLLAVTNMVGEDTFYEGASDRDERFRNLIATVVAEDPSFIQRMIPWLRNEANMRSASIVMAVEYVTAGGPNGRGVVFSAISRADEPAEVLAYWKSRNAGSPPAAIKRGVADAVRVFYNQRNSLKYDGLSRNWRMADVIEVVHPKPINDDQSLLFKYLLDKRHHSDTAVPEDLAMLSDNAALQALPPAQRRIMLNVAPPEFLANAGMTWESLSGWLGGPMDAKAWEKIIPSMGYMALIRNLRNFDQAGISPATVKAVAERIADLDQVARSRQFPFRFLSAAKSTSNAKYLAALEDALDASVKNIPVFPGRTLVMVDTSASMRGAISARSTMSHLEVGALFGLALKKVNLNGVSVHGFANQADISFGIKPAEGVLSAMNRFDSRVGVVGHGTDIVGSIKQVYSGEDRVIVISDMQMSYYGQGIHNVVPNKARVYAFNTAGYAVAAVDTRNVNTFEFGGLTDKAFTSIAAIEAFKSASWPF
jgi:hypothetical protein